MSELSRKIYEKVYIHLHSVNAPEAGLIMDELKNEVDMQKVIPEFVRKGVWIRPFGKLVYLMPPYIINDDDLNLLTKALVEVVGSI